MDDASPAFDTYVYDVSDDPDPPSFPRTTTDEEVVVHVRVLGLWHRRKPNLSATACGIKYHAQFCDLRREELTHPLCPECFTASEVGDADAARAKEREGTL